MVIVIHVLHKLLLEEYICSICVQDFHLCFFFSYCLGSDFMERSSTSIAIYMEIGLDVIVCRGDNEGYLQLTQLFMSYTQHHKKAHVYLHQLSYLLYLE